MAHPFLGLYVITLGIQGFHTRLDPAIKSRPYNPCLSHTIHLCHFQHISYLCQESSDTGESKLQMTCMNESKTICISHRTKSIWVIVSTLDDSMMILLILSLSRPSIPALLSLSAILERKPSALVDVTPFSILKNGCLRGKQSFIYWSCSTTSSKLLVVSHYLCGCYSYIR